jgi:phage terminase small subunit
MFKLTPKQAKFAKLYFETGKVADSYRASYDAERMTEGSVATAATDLLAHPEIVKYLAQLESEAANVAQLNVAWILDKYAKIATGDVRELVESRVECCRHCHGVGHNYQWLDANEWAVALADAMDLNARITERNLYSKAKPAELVELPTFDGGGGFWGTNPPHADCPKCFGNGTQRTHIHDTRKLSESGRLLYAGIKQTANGPEIKTRDQDGALAWLAKYFGVDKRTLELSAPGGGPIGLVSMKPEDLSDEALAAIVAAQAQSNG